MAIGVVVVTYLLLNSAGINVFSELDFDDIVRIKPLKVEGRVISFWLRRDNWFLVEVRYFMNNKLESDYFYKDELEKI